MEIKIIVSDSDWCSFEVSDESMETYLREVLHTTRTPATALACELRKTMYGEFANAVKGGQVDKASHQFSFHKDLYSNGV